MSRVESPQTDARALTSDKHQTTNGKPRTRGVQLVGLLLWRFGLLLAASSGVYNLIKLVMRFVDFPLQIEIGIGLILAGMIFVAGSFLFERLADYRREGDLR